MRSFSFSILYPILEHKKTFLSNFLSFLGCWFCPFFNTFPSDSVIHHTLSFYLIFWCSSIPFEYNTLKLLHTSSSLHKLDTYIGLFSSLTVRLKSGKGYHNNITNLRNTETTQNFQPKDIRPRNQFQ